MAYAKCCRTQSSVDASSIGVVSDAFTFTTSFITSQVAWLILNTSITKFKLPKSLNQSGFTRHITPKRL